MDGMHEDHSQEAPAQPRPKLSGLLAAVWGLGAIALLLIQALWRLTPLAVEPLRSRQLTLAQAALYAAWVAVNAYAEGYRGFQKQFVPRCAARARALAKAPTLLRALLAPAYCMSLFAAPRRRMIVSWTLLIAITMLVIIVKKLAQPWRGIIDGGVVVGLSWGLFALVIRSLSVFGSARS